jgi:hypothetical protein
MISNHRITRNRRVATAGSIGAPFLGSFVVDFGSLNKVAGTAELFAYNESEFGWVTNAPQWTPNKTVDPSAFSLYIDEVEVPITSAVVNNIGTRVLITFPGSPNSVQIVARPGHPALLDAHGRQCSGTYRDA